MIQLTFCNSLFQGLWALESQDIRTTKDPSCKRPHMVPSSFAMRQDRGGLYVYDLRWRWQQAWDERFMLEPINDYLYCFGGSLVYV